MLVHDEYLKRIGAKSLSQSGRRDENYERRVFPTTNPLAGIKHLECSIAEQTCSA